MIGALSDWWFRWVGGARVELAGAINGAIPPVPPELGQACQTLSDFVAGLGPFGAIFPWWAVSIALGFWLVGVGVAITVKLTRIKISLFTGGGGA